MRKMLLGLAAAVAISLGALSLDAATDEEDNPTALAGAMSGVKTTLEAGLKASEREGEPISAKFGIEDGKLQLSIYTATEELSPNFGDGRRVQAAAVWDREDAGLTATSIPSVNVTP
jgi:hypothetical protein